MAKPKIGTTYGMLGHTPPFVSGGVFDATAPTTTTITTAPGSGYMHNVPSMDNPAPMVVYPAANGFIIGPAPDYNTGARMEAVFKQMYVCTDLEHVMTILTAHYCLGANPGQDRDTSAELAGDTTTGALKQ